MAALIHAVPEQWRFAVTTQNNELVKPARVGGFNDYSPTEMAARRLLADKIRVVYETFGFETIETPMFEFMEVLTGLAGSDMRVWSPTVFSRPTKEELRQRLDRGLAGLNLGVSDQIGALMNCELKGANAEEALRRILRGTPDRPLGLRFDHTVPLARYVAANMGNLQLPWRRQVFGPVFRGESPQAGRYNQFYQFDADIVGDPRLEADAEVIWMMVLAMSELTDRPFKVRWNSRKIINALAEVIGVDGFVVDPTTNRTVERRVLLFRIVDKLDKIGWDGVKEELERPPQDEWDTLVLALNTEQIGTVERYLSIVENASDPSDALNRLESLIGNTPSGGEGVQDLRAIANLLSAFGVDEARHGIDLSIARGLDYYDGVVFETLVEGAEQFGSVYSGGRYNGLVSRFTGAPLPSVGASIGFDRLFALLQSVGELPEARSTPIKALILNFGKEADQFTILGILSSLRNAGIPAEVYHGPDSSFRAQLGSAIRRGIPFAVIPGERELATGNVAVKNLSTRSQDTVPLTRLARFLTK